MQIFTVPAKYAPEIEAALRCALRSIRFDMKLREIDGPDAKPYVNVDDSRSGDMVVLVAPAWTRVGEIQVALHNSDAKAQEGLPDSAAAAEASI